MSKQEDNEDTQLRTEETFDLTPSPRLLQVLGEIPMLPWACVAELVDNSFDAFSHDDAQQPDAGQWRVDVELPSRDRHEEMLVVRDNGIGMTRDALESSLKAGYSGKSSFGSFGLFGMGFNIASARLGTRTTVTTSQAGDNFWRRVTIDPAKLQELDTFEVPCELVPKDDSSEHGTRIEIWLKPQIAGELSTRASVRGIRSKLGDVYSYLLRREIPGIKNEALSGPRNYLLVVDGEAVSPKLPCVWDESRFVTVQGDEIRAIQEIHRTLAPAIACAMCGHWHRANEAVVNCLNCGSSEVETRERSVWGWVGVQRYLDTQDFGVDFLRNGRKILLKDKSIFTYEDPDTGYSDAEYPVEMPANKGRLVGEIHLDHVPVTFSKNGFQVESKDWLDAREVVRGASPMKPRAARSQPNHSPLALLFKGYRRNDGGRKYLVPGNGEKAINDKTAQWGELFHAGDPAYYTDAKWFEAVEKHERIKSGEEDFPSEEPSEGPIGGLLGGPGGSKSTGDTDEQEEKPTETDEERYSRYQAKGYKRDDLSGPLNVGDAGSWDLTFWITQETLLDPSGNQRVAMSRVTKGSSVEVYVDRKHSIFEDYGRDYREYGLLEVITSLNATTVHGSAEILANVLQQLPDQQLTTATVMESIRSLARRIGAAMQDAEIGGAHWEILDPTEKVEAETRASAEAASLDWEGEVDSGGYLRFLSMGALAHIVRERPDLCLDGKVFTTGWESWPNPETRERAVSRLVNPMELLGSLESDPSQKPSGQLQVARLLLDDVDEQLGV